MTPRPRYSVTCELLLSGLGDDGASDARRRRARCFAGDGMNHHGGSAVAENGVVVSPESDVRSHNRGVSGAVGAHDQREIGNITGGQRAVFVPGAIGIEVRTGGLEVGTIAFGELVDVKRVFAR